MSAPTVFIATPVYKGDAFVAETLEAIRRQELQDFRVLMSVDGADEASARACAPYTKDPRFELVLQPERLGWAGNLNWLMARAEGAFFTYWQHDDLATPTYLKRLHQAAMRNPGAAATFCDVQWFGARTDVTEQPSVRGFALGRVLRQIEQLYWVPFRGLIRTEALRATGPIRETPFGSNQEDLVWVAKLAREGDLVRVPGREYLKRAHRQNVHFDWFSWPPEKRRGAWLELGIGLIDAAMPLLPQPADQAHLVQVVASRLVNRKKERWMYHAFDSHQDQLQFVADLFEQAAVRCGAPRPPMPRPAGSAT